MDKGFIMEISTSMIAFTGFLAGLFTSLYYFIQIRNVNFVEGLLFAVIYLNINFLFLYIKKGGI